MSFEHHERMRLFQILEQIEINTRPEQQFTREDQQVLDALLKQAETLVKRFDKLVADNK